MRLGGQVHAYLQKVESLKEIQPFNKEDIFKILDIVPDKIKAFFAIGFFTGARTGEINALKWSNIDFENKVIQIRATRNKGIETTPKTLSSIRDVANYFRENLI